MKIKISLAHSNKESWSSEEDKRHLSQPDCLEPTFDFSDSSASEAVREIILRPGMKLVMVDFMPAQTTTVGFEIDQAPLEFSFSVSGGVRATISSGRRPPNELHIGSGECNISCFPESRGTMVYQPRKQVRRFSIHVNPRLFQYLHEEEPGGFTFYPRFTKEIVSSNYYFRHIAMTPSIRMAAHQILNCPYHGLAGRLYLEGKAIEFIALLIADLDSGRKTPISALSLRSSDRERIHQAKDILTSDLTSPPSLIELSRSVGLTHTKLNQGFREIYGTTAFDYLRRQRLEHGWLLLKEGRLNVSEVAYAVGFSSPSHFANSFRHHFGIQPNAFLKELLNKTTLQSV